MCKWTLYECRIAFACKRIIDRNNWFPREERSFEGSDNAGCLCCKMPIRRPVRRSISTGWLFHVSCVGPAAKFFSISMHESRKRFQSLRVFAWHVYVESESRMTFARRIFGKNRVWTFNFTSWFVPVLTQSFNSIHEQSESMCFSLRRSRILESTRLAEYMFVWKNYFSWKSIIIIKMLNQGNVNSIRLIFHFR